jgi:hypothetical protein
MIEEKCLFCINLIGYFQITSPPTDASRLITLLSKRALNVPTGVKEYLPAERVISGFREVKSEFVVSSGFTMLEFKLHEAEVVLSGDNSSKKELLYSG